MLFETYFIVIVDFFSLFTLDSPFTDAVTSDDVAAVIAISTGIPLPRLVMGEREKLLSIESVLAQRVVGMMRCGYLYWDYIEAEFRL